MFALSQRLKGRYSVPRCGRVQFPWRPGAGNGLSSLTLHPGKGHRETVSLTTSIFSSPLFYSSLANRANGDGLHRFFGARDVVGMRVPPHLFCRTTQGMSSLYHRVLGMGQKFQNLFSWQKVLKPTAMRKVWRRLQFILF